MTSVTYSTDNKDFDAALKCLLASARTLGIAAPVGVILGLATYAFLLSDGQDRIASLLPAIAIGCIVVLFAWSQLKRQRALIRKANIDAKNWIAGEQTLTLTEVGIDRRSSGESVQKAWSSLAQVILTPSHLLLVFPFSFSWIVPLGDLTEDQRQDISKMLLHHTKEVRRVK